MNWLATWEKSSGRLVQPVITYAIVALFIYLAVMGRLSGEFITSIIMFVVKAWWDKNDQEKRDETLVNAALAQPKAGG